MRRPVRFATAWVKCLMLCVSNQSGLLAIAERRMGTSAACRIRPHKRLRGIRDHLRIGQFDQPTIVFN